MVGGRNVIHQEGRITSHSESISVLSNISIGKCIWCCSRRGLLYIRPKSACVLTSNLSIISSFSHGNIGPRLFIAQSLLRTGIDAPQSRRAGTIHAILFHSSNSVTIGQL
jgi:hypothetical protein